MQPTIEITTVIVNYRLREMLEQTLLSVRAAYDGAGCEGEIIVVDNNSGDGYIDEIRPLFPDVAFVMNADNPGFGKANNQAFAMARGKYVLILNPDTVISASNLRECLALMRSEPRCGCIGVRMFDGNGRFHPESKRGFPTVGNAFFKLFGLASLFPHSKLFGGYNLKYLDERQPHKVPVLAGAYMFARREVLEVTGGFDEDFFMYGEDIDLSYRISAAGYDNYYLPTPMIHYKGECTKTDSMKYVRTFYEAMTIFYKKHYPRSGFAASLMVKAGIRFRMCVQAVRNVAIHPLMRLLPRREQRGRLLYVVSQYGEEVARSASVAKKWDGRQTKCIGTLDNIPADVAQCDILIDDRAMSYDDIIAGIDARQSKGRKFYIYMSSRCAVIP